MKTSTFSVLSAGYIPVYATVPAKTITVKEDPSVAAWPTTDYLIKGNDPSSTEIRIPSGVEFSLYEARVVCNVGQLLGYIKAVTADTTFQLIEKP